MWEFCSLEEPHSHTQVYLGCRQILLLGRSFFKRMKLKTHQNCCSLSSALLDHVRDLYKTFSWFVFSDRFSCGHFLAERTWLLGVIFDRIWTNLRLYENLRKQKEFYWSPNFYVQFNLMYLTPFRVSDDNYNEGFILFLLFIEMIGEIMFKKEKKLPRENKI